MKEHSKKGWTKVYCEDCATALPIANPPRGVLGYQVVWYKKRFAKEYYKKCGLKCPQLSILWAKIEGPK